MGRPQGSGRFGPTRSVRVPSALEAQVAAYIDARPQHSVSELLIRLVHGGLRLRSEYAAIQRWTLERYLAHPDMTIYSHYIECLVDTFGAAYVDDLIASLHDDHQSAPFKRAALA